MATIGHIAETDWDQAFALETYQQRVERLRQVYRERFPKTPAERLEARREMWQYRETHRWYFHRLWKELAGEDSGPDDRAPRTVVFKEPKPVSLVVELPKAPQTIDLDKIRGTD